MSTNVDHKCYVALSSEIPLGPNDEPRCDLMEEWLVAINNYISADESRAKWTVEWAPARTGLDKGNWVYLYNALNLITGTDDASKKRAAQSAKSTSNGERRNPDHLSI